MYLLYYLNKIFKAKTYGKTRTHHQK